MKFDKQGNEITTYTEYIGDCNESLHFRKESINRQKADLKRKITRLQQDIAEFKSECARSILLEKNYMAQTKARKNREGYQAMKEKAPEVYNSADFQKFVQMCKESESKSQGTEQVSE